MFALFKKQNKKKIKEDTAFALRLKTLFVKRFSLRDQTLFAKRLSFLVKSGVPLLEGLEMLRNQMRSLGTKTVLDRVIADVANGKFLSSSLERFEGIFGDFAINMIRVGESSGILSENLTYLAEELKKRTALRKKVMGALVYPIFITVATLGVTGVLTAYIFPRILPIFASLNVSLPFTTRVLIVVSDFLRDYGLWVIGGLIVSLIVFVFLHRNLPPFRIAFDRLVLHIPIVGTLVWNYNMANFSRTLGILLKSGVTVNEALHITARTTANRFYRRDYRAIAERIMRGEQLSRHLLERPRTYPHIFAHMVVVGERTGTLSDTLLYLSDFYEQEVDELTKNLSSVIEPVLMVVMGILVGFVAISVITPIYEITKSFNR